MAVNNLQAGQLQLNAYCIIHCQDRHRPILLMKFRIARRPFMRWKIPIFRRFKLPLKNIWCPSQVTKRRPSAVRCPVSFCLQLFFKTLHGSRSFLDSTYLNIYGHGTMCKKWTFFIERLFWGFLVTDGRLKTICFLIYFREKLQMQ